MGRAVADDRSKSNRIATLNAAPPRAGIHIPKAKDLRKPETTNLSLSLGVPKGVFSFAKENTPFASCSAVGAAILILCKKNCKLVNLYEIYRLTIGGRHVMMSPVFLRKGRITMKNIKTRDLIYCALFAALTAIGAFLHFQLFQATITLQFFFTAMAGLLLGAKLGALSQLLYVVLGLVGVPIFAAGGGFGYVFNPTFGFLLGLIPTAWVIGKIAEKDRSVPRLLLACFAGLAVLYLVGLPYIALIVNVYKGGNVSGMTLATAYMLPYLPGDCLKIVVSVILAPRILKAMERNS